MDKESRVTLEVLSMVEKNNRVTQKDIANSLKISVGLTNLFVKRLAKKGYIKLTSVPVSRAKYILTPQGLVEKSKLFLSYMQHSAGFFKNIREILAEKLTQLKMAGFNNVVLYGAGDVGEITYLFAKEFGFNIVAVIDDKKAGKKLFDREIISNSALKELNYDRVVITSFRAIFEIDKKLTELKIPKEKIEKLLDLAEGEVYKA